MKRQGQPAAYAEARHEVLLRWRVQRGIPLVTNVTHRDRMCENALAFDFELSPGGMDSLDALECSGGARAALERDWW